MPGKRDNVISWDEFFMRVAAAAGMRSKDPNTQVGACIAGPDHRILSVGYNGTPSNLDDDDFAILNCRGSLKDLSGATCYVTLFPCQECAKTLAQAGIGEVVYLSDKYGETIGGKVAKAVLDRCGVTYRQIDLPEEALA